MKFDRAWRRAQDSRLKKNRQDYWSFTNSSGKKKTPRQIGILLSTPKTCSCWMCGNPRHKHDEKPISQIRAEQIDKEMLDFLN